MDAFKEVKVIIALVIVLVMAVTLTIVGLKIAGWKADAAVGEQRGAKINATSNIISDGAEEQKKADAIDTGVIGAKNVYGESYAKEYQTNPVVRNWADGIRPDSLRKLAKERRIARERFGRDVEQRQDQVEAESPK